MNRFSIIYLIFLLSFLFSSDLWDVALKIEGNSDDGSFDVYMINEEVVGGFQLYFTGGSGFAVTSGSGGSAAAAGFLISPGGSTVLGLSLTGATIPASDQGALLVTLSHSGDASDIELVYATSSAGSETVISGTAGSFLTSVDAIDCGDEAYCPEIMCWSGNVDQNEATDFSSTCNVCSTDDTEISLCTDSSGENTNACLPIEFEDNDTCVASVVNGCTDTAACNYWADATVDDGTCLNPNSWTCSDESPPVGYNGPYTTGAECNEVCESECINLGCDCTTFVGACANNGADCTNNDDCDDNVVCEGVASSIQRDCNEDCAGSATVDDCGNCYGGGTTNLTQGCTEPQDPENPEDGVCVENWAKDACGKCPGGTCEKDGELISCTQDSDCDNSCDLNNLYAFDQLTGYSNQMQLANYFNSTCTGCEDSGGDTFAWTGEIDGEYSTLQCESSPCSNISGDCPAGLATGIDVAFSYNQLFSIDTTLNDDGEITNLDTTIFYRFYDQTEVGSKAVFLRLWDFGDMDNAQIFDSNQDTVDHIYDLESGVLAYDVQLTIYFDSITGEKQSTIQSVEISDEVLSNSTEIYTPSESYLRQNYPNPFNPSTTIQFELPVSGLVSIYIYDIHGNLIQRLIDNEYYASGSIHSIQWNVHSSSKVLPSGIYFCQIHSSGFYDMKKMLYIK